MPTYQYFCSKCEQEFEIFQSMTEKPLAICPEPFCRMRKWGRGRVKKLIGAGAGLIFKGTGFHTTDYRSEKYKEAAQKEAPSPSSSGGEGKSSASKPESKPAKTEKAAK